MKGDILLTTCNHLNSLLTVELILCYKSLFSYRQRAVVVAVEKQREPTTVVFIGVVPTVIVVVALPAARHAAVVLTAELVWLTCPLIWAPNRHDKQKHGPITNFLSFFSPSTTLPLPHSSLGSSEASPQSSSPSHFQRAGMQRPESLQRNSSTPHVIWAAVREDFMDWTRWHYTWDYSLC